MIQLHEKDNVAVAVEDVVSGQELTVKTPATMEDGRVSAAADIPFGHKCALCDIKKGELIVKYGHPIGQAIADIPRGDVVGVHNMEGLRGRGDLKSR